MQKFHSTRGGVSSLEEMAKNYARNPEYFLLSQHPWGYNRYVLLTDRKRGRSVYLEYHEIDEFQRLVEKYDMQYLIKKKDFIEYPDKFLIVLQLRKLGSHDISVDAEDETLYVRAKPNGKIVYKKNLNSQIDPKNVSFSYKNNILQISVNK